MENMKKHKKFCISANSYFLQEGNIDDIISSFILLGEITYKMEFIKGALNYFMQADAMLNEYDYINEYLKAKLYYNIALCNYKLKKFITGNKLCYACRK